MMSTRYGEDQLKPKSLFQYYIKTANQILFYVPFSVLDYKYGDIGKQCYGKAEGI